MDPVTIIATVAQDAARGAGADSLPSQCHWDRPSTRLPFIFGKFDVKNAFEPTFSLCLNFKLNMFSKHFSKLIIFQYFLQRRFEICVKQVHGGMGVFLVRQRHTRPIGVRLQLISTGASRIINIRNMLPNLGTR